MQGILQILLMALMNPVKRSTDLCSFMISRKLKSEGYEGGFIPFNCGSLPVVSGISVEIKKTDDGYTLSKVTKDGKQIQDDDTFTVTCLAIPKHMEAYPTDENIVFDGGDISVDDTWTAYVSDGDAILAEPEDYMTLR